jgi:chorismate synthase
VGGDTSADKAELDGSDSVKMVSNISGGLLGGMIGGDTCGLT